MKHLKRMALAAIVAVLTVVGVSVPAFAGSSLCWPSGAPSTARLSVSSWNSSYYSGNTLIIRYTYHMDVNSGGYFAKKSITINVGGGNQYFGPDDAYAYSSDPSATIYGYWTETVNPGTEFQFKRTRSCVVANYAN